MSDRTTPNAATGLLAGGSKSFFQASKGLPERVRAPATVLYAYCRLADDAVDEAPGCVADAVADLEARLDDIYAGTPSEQDFDREFSELVHAVRIPRVLPQALIEGFAWDAAGRRYRTLSDVRAYSARVAATVGAMMALVLGVRDRHVLARATDLGVAMQLTNIARDVGEDARAGRLYLPTYWLAAEGIDADRWLAQPEQNEAIRGLVHRLLAEADRLYSQADAGIDALPRSCRFGIFAAGRLYEGIGLELMREGIDPLTRRAVVPRRRKRQLVIDAMASSVRSLLVSHDCSAYPVLPETAFLVDAAADPVPPDRQPAWYDLPAHTGAVVRMLEAMERRQRG